MSLIKKVRLRALRVDSLQSFFEWKVMNKQNIKMTLLVFPVEKWNWLGPSWDLETVLSKVWREIMWL